MTVTGFANDCGVSIMIQYSRTPVIRLCLGLCLDLCQQEQDRHCPLLSAALLGHGLGFSRQDDLVWYVLFIVFVTYAMLPLPLRWCVTASGVTASVHLGLLASGMHDEVTTAATAPTIPLPLFSVPTTLSSNRAECNCLRTETCIPFGLPAGPHLQCAVLRSAPPPAPTHPNRKHRRAVRRAESEPRTSGVSNPLPV